MDLDVERIESLICNKCGENIDATGTEPFSRVVCPKCEAKLSVPAKLGNLLLLKPIGKGSMGVVYRALDTTLRRTVAVKILKDVDKEDEDRAKSCLQEARSLAALNQPNVVHVFTIGIERNQPYIVMELVDGGHFDAMIKKEGPVDEMRALEITIESAEGLRAALGAGLIHGDIKPANILLDRQGVAKLVDFGIARRVDDDEGHGFLGTPYYVAPEIVRKKRIDHRCDIFSLGATLYQALTGKQTYQGDTVKQVVKARLEGPARNVRELVPTLHPETAAVVAHMLEADPDDRYQDYDELIAALHGALEAARRGPVDPMLADLGMAAEATPVPGPALLPGASRTAGARAKGTARKITSKMMDEDGLSINAIALLLGGLAVLSIVLLLVIYVMTRGGGTGTGTGTGVDPVEQGTVFEFSGPNLNEKWSLRGEGGYFSDTGSYTLACNGKGTYGTLRYTIGKGDFEAELHLKGISWNPQVATRIWMNFWDSGDNEILIEIIKDRTASPIMRITNYVKGVAQPSMDIDMDDMTDLKLKFRWEDTYTRLHISYGINGAGPNTTVKPVMANYSPSSTEKRKFSVGVSAVEGEGAASAEVDFFRYKALDP